MKLGLEWWHILKAIRQSMDDSFVWEINGVNTTIFESYLKEFSKYNPNEYKIVVIDNAGFHSTKNIEVPEYFPFKNTSLCARIESLRTKCGSILKTDIKTNDLKTWKN